MLVVIQMTVLQALVMLVNLTGVLMDLNVVMQPGMRMDLTVLH
jgi:hypothetical protein